MGFKIKVSGLEKLKKEINPLQREAKQLDGTRSIPELRQKLRGLGLDEGAVEQFLAEVPKSGVGLTDDLVRTLARHNTTEQFEADIRRANPGSTEAEIDEAVRTFRKARQDLGKE